MAGAPAHERRGVVIQPRVLLIGGALALVGLVILGLFLWMVPSAAAREEKAACRGLRGDEPLSPRLCDGRPCQGPRPAPDFTARDNEGKPVKLSSYRGKVVLLNFWASWCSVCKTEKPSLAALADDLGDRDDFVVLTLASDQNWADVLVAIVASLDDSVEIPSGPISMQQALALYGKMNRRVPFDVLLDPPDDDGNIGAITKTWGIKAVPESALIDREGNIRAYFVNKRDWRSPVAKTCLRSVLEE